MGELFAQIAPQILSWAAPIVLEQIQRFKADNSREPTLEELIASLHATVQAERAKIAAAKAEPEGPTSVGP
jgi:hypothetical protein